METDQEDAFGRLLEHGDEDLFGADVSHRVVQLEL